MAEGAAKPTSVYSVVRVEQSLVVVAHLSEGIPRYWLLDNSAPETFVEAKMTFGLQLAGGGQGVDYWEDLGSYYSGTYMELDGQM